MYFFFQYEVIFGLIFFLSKSIRKNFKINPNGVKIMKKIKENIIGFVNLEINEAKSSQRTVGILSNLGLNKVAIKKKENAIIE